MVKSKPNMSKVVGGRVLVHDSVDPLVGPFKSLKALQSNSKAHIHV